MQILEYVLYIVLLFITLGWILGVRKKYNIIYPTILGSFLFSLASLILPLLRIDFLHIIWIIPSIFICILIYSYLLVCFGKTLVFSFIHTILNIYTRILRIGVSGEYIEKERKRLNRSSFMKECNLDEEQMKKYDELIRESKLERKPW